jgi:outer membrane protein TolC
MRSCRRDRFSVFCVSCRHRRRGPDDNGPPPGNAAISPAGFEQDFLQSVAKGPGLAPRFWRPYLQQSLPHPVLLNSPRLGSLIHDGRLELSLADALALTIENNLDIVVQRYVVPYLETDILRTKSGQAARGFSGALYPSELNSGAIGAGVSNAGGTGGTGNAGGITGGGGAVAVGPAGAFDPTVNLLYSWDRVVSPLNSLVVSGIPTTTSYATAFSASYAQMFTTGASYSVSLSTLRQSTTQKNTLFNPDVTSRLSIGFNQPLLAGFGRLANERFIMVARNNQGTAQEVFREQVIASVAQLVAAYYDLVSFQSNVRVARESLAALTQLVSETRRQEEIGLLARLDVVTAESQLASSRRDLIVAETNLQQQETTLKQLLSKRDDPDLDSAAIAVTDPLPEPREADIPNLSAALETALANRPELRQARNNLANQNTAIAYARNNLLPNTSVFGLYAGAGLQGNTATQTGGAAGSLGQTFSAVYPESAFGVSFAASIRNRSAQADNVRSQLERNQLEIGLQNTSNQINLQVQQARVGLVQGQAQVEAAHEAVRLALESRDAERAKLRAGISTPYNVVLKERDLVSAQYAEVQVSTAYAKAMIALDQATGTTLERNGIRLDDALSGTVSQRPTPDLNLPLNPDRGGER